MAFIIDDILLIPLNLGKQILEGIRNEVDKERLLTKEVVIDKLKELQLLLDEGKIREEEYNKLEKQIMERLRYIREMEK